MPALRLNNRKVTQSATPVASKHSKYIELCGDQKAVSLLQHEIRSVQIDCCFRFASTKWGHIDHICSGVIYIDLTIQQPEGCRLTSALMTLTLTPIDSETSEAEAEAQRGNRTGEDLSMNTTPKPASSGPEITEFFGPKAIYGKAREVSYSTRYLFQPEVNAGFVSAGGVGVQHIKGSTDTNRWKFEGWRRGVVVGEESTSRKVEQERNNPGSANNAENEPANPDILSAKYRKIMWRLEENQGEAQVFRSPTLHTAFAFEHGNKPFLLEVEFEGKLRHRHHRALERLVFPPKKKKVNARAKIDAEKLSRGIHEDLKSIAVGLDEAMFEMNNRSQGKVIREPEQVERTATPTQPQLPHTAARSLSTEENHAQTSRNDILAISRQLLKLEQAKVEETMVETTVETPVETPLSNGSIETTRTIPQPEQTSTESLIQQYAPESSKVLSIAHFVPIYWAAIATWLAILQKWLNN